MSVLDDVEAAAGLSVYGAASIPGAVQRRQGMLDAGVPGQLMAKDATLWGPDAAAEASIRLGWVDTFRRSRQLLPRLVELRRELAGLDHVVLAGMGGSSLAPEVITKTLGRPLTVLDTTDPGQIRAAMGDRLERTVIVVSSKSGGTVETDSHRRAYLQALLDLGLDAEQAGARFVVVTDPGSPLEQVARQMGAHLVLADAQVGGRYSALTAFGLVPAGLAGVDVATLLDEAEALFGRLGDATDNPGLALGAALGAAAVDDGRDKVVLVDDGTGITGLGDWAEQLLAESTGKQGKGILPVVVQTPEQAGSPSGDVLTVSLGGALPPAAVPGGGAQPDIAVNGPLGAQFLTWEYATAIAGRILGINPFDQPNVTESKDNTKHILATGMPAEPDPVIDAGVQIYGGAGPSVAEALHGLVAGVATDGYLAIMAYLDRLADAAAAELRAVLAAASRRPVTFGWGPRFLHSTGQFHKGGPQVGSFLQITGVVVDDLPIPDQPYTFGTLQAAQAAGDRVALSARGRPLLRLHLTDRAAGIEALLEAARSLGGDR